jgi:putative transposase
LRHGLLTSTRGAILDRYGLVQRRRHHRRAVPTAPPLTVATAPNDVWCTDFKGWFRTGDGRRCDPGTLQDACSRMLLACAVVERPDTVHLRPVFKRAFQEYGLPRVIRSDNGPPFGSTGLGGLTELNVWWVKLGIQVERIAPGHPEQNGQLERLHRTLKADCCSPPAATCPLQQERFATWRVEYNTERPHEALGQTPPAAHYTPSLRRYPARFEDPPYPRDAIVRRVRSNGEIKWRGGLVYVSAALQGEAVGLLETPTGWTIRFGPILLGLVDPCGERVVPTQRPTTKRNRKA